MNPLTAKQSQVLDFIKSQVDSNGYPPTFQEIGDHFGWTKKGAWDHVAALIKKGALGKTSGKRTLALTARKSDPRFIPVLSLKLVDKIKGHE